MPVLIGAKPEWFEPAAGPGDGRGVLDVLLLERGAALGVGQHPCRRRRQRGRRVEDGGRVGEADRRPDHPSMRLDLVGDKGIAKIRARLEPSKFGLRIVAKDGEQELALVRGDQRPVVGDEFSEQGSNEQHEKDPERPCAALVAAKIVEPPLVHRREPRTALQARAFFRLLPCVCLFVARDGAIRRYVGLRLGISALGEAVRIDQAHTSRVSKSMRGSIQV